MTTTKLSLGILLALSTTDSAVVLAAMRGICNKALGQCIGQAQRIVRARDDENDRTGTGTLDARNEQDDAREHDIPPPDGLNAPPTPEDLLAQYANIYACAHARLQAMATSDYDYPQDIDGRLDFIVQRARESLTTRPARFASEGEKIAFAAQVTQAQRDWEFWKQYRGEIQSLVKDAIDNIDVPEDDVDALDTLDGIELHQYAVQAGVGIAQTMARLKLQLARFSAGTVLGRELASDFGALETFLPKVRAFVDEVENKYAGDILAAAKAGRTLFTAEQIDVAYDNSVDRAVEKALKTQREFKDFAIDG